MAAGDHGSEGLDRPATGERLGGFIYGTVVALAVVAASAKAYPDAAGHIAALVAATAGALWFAHVYAHGLAHSVSRDRHLSRDDLGFIARHEASVLEAAVPPIVALLLGAVGLLSTKTAVWAAFGLGLVVLATNGIQFARVERLGLLATVGVVTANLGLGVLLIALKLLLTH